jgi:transposase-like protein
VFPETQIQMRIVHLLRGSMDYAGRKDRKPVEAALKLIWLQFREAPQNQKLPAREWRAARAHLALLFGARFEMHQ